MTVKNLLEKYNKSYKCKDYVFFSNSSFYAHYISSVNISHLNHLKLIKHSFANKEIYQPYKEELDYFPEFLIRIHENNLYYCELPEERTEVKSYEELENKIENNFGLTGGLSFGAIEIVKKFNVGFYGFDKWEFSTIPYAILYNSPRLFYFDLKKLFPSRFKLRFGHIENFRLKELKEDSIVIEVLTTYTPRYLSRRDYVISMEYDIRLLNYQIIDVKSEEYSLK